jgi:hypothetical protein
LTHQITSFEQLERAEAALRQEGYGEPEPAMSEERTVSRGRAWIAAILLCSLIWAAIIGMLFALLT